MLRHAVFGLSVFEWLFLAALVFLIFVLPRMHRKSSGKKREAVLRALGFADQPRDEVFEHAQALAYMMFDFATSTIADTVAFGQSALGDTALFEFWTGVRGSDATSTPTLAFRMPPGVPDFRIEGLLLGNRIMHVTNDVDIGAPESLRKYDHHSHQWVGPQLDIPVLKRVHFPQHADFESKFYVWSADVEWIRRLLTPTAMAALMGLKDSRINILKRMDWMLVWGSNASNLSHAGGYANFLSQTVQWVQGLNLTPGADTPAMPPTLPVAAPSG